MTMPSQQPAEGDPACETPSRVAPLGRPSPYGDPAAIDGLGGVAAPLLGGFSLALIGLVGQVPQNIRWPDLALLLLSLTAVAMLAAVQFTYRARRFAATPADAAGWHPDFADSPERRDRVYAEIRANRIAHRVWSARARLFYNAGVCLLLLGLAVTLVPPEMPHVIRIVTVALVLLGFAGELVLIGGGWLLAGRLGGRLPHRVQLAAWWLTSADPLTRPETTQTPHPIPRSP